MRPVIHMLLSLALAPWLAGAAMAEPVVTIVFSANNQGFFAPCPVCGNNALGGLARRATAFEDIRKNQAAAKRTVFIAGPYELLSADTPPPPAQNVWPALSKAFARLNYSAGCVSPAEAKALADQGLPLPPGWQTLGKEVLSQVIETPGGNIGVLFFPAVSVPEAGPSPEVMAKIAREAKKLRPSVKLLVGVSSWGVYAERIYLEKAGPVLDVLLGGGDGVGFSARPAAGGRTVWMHSYSQGKAVYELNVLAWPGGAGFAWEPETRFTSRAILLDQTLAPEPEMEALFAGLAPAEGPAKP
jgi:hypothetical protein